VFRPAHRQAQRSTAEDIGIKIDQGVHCWMLQIVNVVTSYRPYRRKSKGGIAKGKGSIARQTTSPFGVLFNS